MAGLVMGRRRRREEAAGGHSGNFLVESMSTTTHIRVLRAAKMEQLIERVRDAELYL